VSKVDRMSVTATSILAVVISRRRAMGRQIAPLTIYRVL
jgi:hypothetical protein